MAGVQHVRMSWPTKLVRHAPEHLSPGKPVRRGIPKTRITNDGMSSTVGAHADRAITGAVVASTIYSKSSKAGIVR